MLAAIRHRGPDGQGEWVDPARALYFGHRRLAILDLAGGAQPMVSADESLVVTYNGEIYNCRELRRFLEGRGHRFVTSHSDTEILLHGYREWGEELPQKLNGMWAFALHDRKKGTIFCSRDRFGKKPFYYSAQDGMFVFASELGAVASHSHVPTRISRTGVKKYFGYGYIPAPLSLYEGIFKLPGGHNLVYELNSGTHSIRKYWEFTLEPFEERPAGIETQWSEKLVELLEGAVRRRLLSDVPVGVFLSGGIDSSIIAHLAARHVGNSPLRTFSIGFDVEGFDESMHARKAAAFVGTEHQERRFSLEEARNLARDIPAGIDEPIGDSSLLPTWLLCKWAKENVTVALGGDGADELFAGYAPFQALSAASVYTRWIPKKVHAAILLALQKLPVSHAYMSLDFKIKRALSGLGYPGRLWNPVWMSSLDPREMEELFQEPVDLEELYEEAIAAWDSCRSPNPVDRTLLFFTRLYLQNDILTKVDRAGMMNGLEVRSPFLDIEVVDFVRRLPADTKLRGRQSKYLLKKAFNGLLPAELLNRKKQGFAVPIGKWFQDGSLDARSAPPLPFLNQQLVSRILADHRSMRQDYRLFLWCHWALAAKLVPS